MNLREPLAYYWAYQSGSYMTDGLTHGLLLDKENEECSSPCEWLKHSFQGSGIRVNGLSPPFGGDRTYPGEWLKAMVGWLAAVRSAQGVVSLPQRFRRANGRRRKISLGETTMPYWHSSFHQATFQKHHLFKSTASNQGSTPLVLPFGTVCRVGITSQHSQT